MSTAQNGQRWFPTLPKRRLLRYQCDPSAEWNKKTSLATLASLAGSRVQIAPHCLKWTVGGDGHAACTKMSETVSDALFRSSAAKWAYLCVEAMSLCPRSSLTRYRSVPELTAMLANVCLMSWILKFEMPTVFTCPLKSKQCPPLTRLEVIGGQMVPAARDWLNGHIAVNMMCRAQN